jgi:hypothetical protein
VLKEVARHRPFLIDDHDRARVIADEISLSLRKWTMQRHVIKSSLILAAAGALLFAGSPSAKADLTKSYTIDAIPETTTDFSDVLTQVKAFNPTVLGGTLESVEVSFTVSITEAMTVQNESSTTNASGKVKTDVTFDLTVKGGTAPDTLSQVYTDSTPYYAPSSSLSKKGKTGDSVSYGAVTTNPAKSDQTYTNATILDEFTGTGKIDLYLSAVASASLSADNKGTVKGTPIGTAELVSGKVTYTYTPFAVIPEPSSLVLGAFGALGGFVLCIRRRTDLWRS